MSGVSTLRMLGEHRPDLTGVKVVYADLDGTLLGPGGSLFAAPGGGVTIAAARAIEALHAAGISLVVMSGRTRRSAEVARALGADAYIAELGALLIERPGPKENKVRSHGAFRGDGSPFDAIVRSGAGAFLLERFPRKLAPVAPWTEATMMFHGFIDAEEANRALEEAGYGWLAFLDNGRLRRTLPDLDVPEIRAYHLLPKGVSKASAVRLHRERNGVARKEAIAIGDSRTDLAVAAEVRAFFLVANGVASVGDVDWPDNAYVTREQRGEGFAETIALLTAG